ncbi:MAG: hypothetical protein OEY11_15150 [Gammaproteobacteria bacterium]|nr:hypothetical protein [Gammaproteobacteria bacterium]
MSGSYPLSPGYKSAIVSFIQPVHQTISGLGNVQTRVLGGRLTTVSLTYAPERRAEFAVIDSFIMRQRGRAEGFTFVMPDKAAPLGNVSGAPVLYDDYPAGVDTIVLDGMVPGVADAFVAADIFNAPGYTLVHKVAFNADSQSANQRYLEDGTPRLLEDSTPRLMEDANTVTLIFSPPLIKNLSKGTAINYQNVAYTMKFKDDSQSVKISAMRTYHKQVEMIEYIS